MSEVVNLRTVRKQRKRAQDRTKGSLQAASSGEAKISRTQRKTEAERADRRLDQHRIDPPETE